VRAALIAALCLALAACDLAYPEVVVENRIGEAVLLRSPSFNGCAWSTVLGDGEATAPGWCLPGSDHVHFQKLGVTDGGTPTWFNYQTISTRRVGYGDFGVFEITSDDLEQDFSIPGPYGH